MEMEFCPECGIALNNSEMRLGFCQNCKVHWEKETAVPISSSQPKEERPPLFADLIYEQDLPEMTDGEYSDWYAQSCIVDGVRMGPPLKKEESDEDLGQLFENNFDCYADSDDEFFIQAITKDKFVEILSLYKLSKRI